MYAKVTKWQHAAESAAGIAEQAKVESECLKAERREADTRGTRNIIHFVVCT